MRFLYMLLAVCMLLESAEAYPSFRPSMESKRREGIEKQKKKRAEKKEKAESSKAVAQKKKEQEDAWQASKEVRSIDTYEEWKALMVKTRRAPLYGCVTLEEPVYLFRLSKDAARYREFLQLGAAPASKFAKSLEEKGMAFKSSDTLSISGDDWESIRPRYSQRSYGGMTADGSNAAKKLRMEALEQHEQASALAWLDITLTAVDTEGHSGYVPMVYVLLNMVISEEYDRMMMTGSSE